MILSTEILLYSDPHFGHKKMLEDNYRPFNTVNEMDNELIKNWNAIVKRHNKVLILGDFSFHVKENIMKIMKQLNGYKMLIMGTHDYNKSNKYFYSLGFEAVSRYPIIWNNIVFSHNPVDVANYQINIHGHLHKNKLSSNQHKCMSVEQINYKPINLNQITIWIKEGYNYTFKFI